MGAILAKAANWLLPLLLDWLLKKAKIWYAEIEKKNELEKERGIVNEKNLKALKECKDLESCILAAKHTYSGSVQDSAKVPANLP